MGSNFNRVLVLTFLKFSDNNERKSRITELVIKYKNKNIKKLIYKHRETQRNKNNENKETISCK